MRVLDLGYNGLVWRIALRVLAVGSELVPGMYMCMYACIQPCMHVCMDACLHACVLVYVGMWSYLTVEQVQHPYKTTYKSATKPYRAL